ncbi:hypothetical protein Tco_0038914 [Tanacetum coccineum]
MLKNFGLEDSKPTKTLMSTEIKLTKDDEADSLDSSKYRGMIGRLLYLTASRPDIMSSVCLCSRFQENPKTTPLEAVKRIFRYIMGTIYLGLWYPKGTRVETIVYADSDHAGNYVDRKSTSVVCTFMGCCLTSWFAKEQTALAISTTEAEYVSAGKACQQALWMKQALIDYDISVDDVPIMCDNKGAIDLSTKMPSEYQQDYKKTLTYAPKIYNDPNMTEQLRDIYRALESRYVHEGRTIDQSFFKDLTDESVAKFANIGFDCLLSLNEQICPRFIMEFYKTLQLDKNLNNNHFHIQFIINKRPFNLSLDQFAELTLLPNQGICLYSDAWGLDELEKNVEQVPPYNSTLPALDDIRNLIYQKTIHEKLTKEGETIHKLPNQIETNALFAHL